MSSNLYNKGQNCYKLNIQKILETYNLSDTILKQTKLSENQIKKIKEHYLKVWREKLNCSKKLEFYKICKTEFGPAKYLTDILDPTHKKELCKFRISSHNLMIEKERYMNPKGPRGERFCPSCKTNFVEDELHLFYICPLYNELRTDYFSKLNFTNEALSSSLSVEKILTICAVVNQAILDEYIFKCTRKRKEILNL